MRRLIAAWKTARTHVFWQFFSSFFILILLPSLVASLFTYLFVVKLIEEEAAKASDTVIGHFADRTDEMVGSLQDEMIMVLGYSGLDRFLRMQDEGLDDLTRNELLEGLMDQLAASTENHPFSEKMYLYLTEHDMVIDKRGHFDKKTYFTYMNQIVGLTDGDIAAWFTGKKMMSFTEPHSIQEKAVYSNDLLHSGRYVSAVISYPFNSDTPKVYLTVNIDTRKLRRQIVVRRGSGIETAIVDSSGNVLAYTGQSDLNGEAVLRAIAEDGAGPTHMTMEKRQWQLSHYASERNDWSYVGMADLEELRRPAALIQRASAVLLLILLLTGAGISYAFSRKMYVPIRDIKQGLETGRPKKGRPPAETVVNDLDAIKMWSQMLLSEHKDMSEQITGMTPVVHEYFLTKVLLGEYRDELSVVFLAKEIGFDAPLTGAFAALGVEVSLEGEDSQALTETAKSFMMTDLMHKIERQLETPVWFCRVRMNFLVCIVHLNQDKDDSRHPARTIQSVLSACLPQFRATIGVGKTVQAVWELHQSYDHSLRLLRRKGLHPGVEICHEQGEWEERLAFDGFLSSDRVNQMLNLYKAGEYASMLGTVKDLLEHGRRGNATEESAKQLCADILNTWLRAIASDHRHDFSIEQYSTLYQRMHRCMTWDELYRFFQETAEVLFQERDPEPRPDEFADILAYIGSHYSSDLTIEQFARQLGMSVGHFSRSFKEAVGEKYIEYLTRCRIEASKRLLLETDLRIDDIAARVGYLGRNSFIKTFRKLEGVTPGKFREVHK